MEGAPRAGDLWRQLGNSLSTRAESTVRRGVEYIASPFVFMYKNWDSDFVLLCMEALHGDFRLDKDKESRKKK